MIEIYGIVNIEGEVVYVGQTSRGRHLRFKEHLRDGKVDDTHSVIKLKECKETELDKWEKFYIKKFNTLGKLNKQEGGKSPRGYSIPPRKQSEEERQWRRETFINPLSTVEARRKKSETMSRLYSSGELLNPMSKTWLVEYDTGLCEEVTSLKKWCRENRTDRSR